MAGMYRKLLFIAALAWLSNPAAQADPIHPIADGAYWHHDSHWVFPEKIAGYVRVGIPQDVAGSEDAVAHYAIVEDGVRNTASVDVYNASSASAPGHDARPDGPLSEDAFAVSAAQAVTGTRRIYTREGRPGHMGVYSLSAGDWRITIRISGSSVEAMDAFVRGQRWEALTDH